MIPLLLIAASVAAPRPAVAPVAPAATSAHELLSGAEHAIREQRLDQARLMVGRAVAAGVSGTELARVLADLAFASGKYDEAALRYQSLAGRFPSDAALLERGGLSALKIGDAKRASPLLRRATSLRGATWRTWNGLGVLADMRGDWAKADECYDKAASLAPREAEPVNNRGWSLLMRGEWQNARGYFERAAAIDPKSIRITNNLDLANMALASDLPKRQPGETDSAWAARLNDAGVAAAMLGDKQRAIAAFTQAIDASGTWYERAANNLEVLSGK
jgi:Flp pilus assembly protein TadD